MHEHRLVSVKEAKRVIRNIQSLVDKRHRRVHMDALEDNSNRLRAINGLCGDCVNLRAYKKFQQGKERISLHCEVFHNPMDLYRNTELGQKAECPDFDDGKISSDGN